MKNFFYNTGNYLNSLDFESCYSLSKEITSIQVKKNVKKNKKCFFEVKDNSLIYKKIKERLVSNLRNLFDKDRKTNILNIENWIIDEIYYNYEIDITTLLDLRKLANSNPQIIIDNIVKLANNFEITSIEIEEIAEKLNIDFSNIHELNLFLQFRNLSKASNNQLYLTFDEKIKVAS
ncbi:MAG: hypothetical protein PHY66_08120 [Aliarcobacter sp.]|nr:hypothetical protein [Aliarcobacter sp.]MDD2887755.1 hypothetical protein [Aliarcobacter sp.]